MKSVRFAVYKHTLEYDSKLLSRFFIVLKGEDDNILAWTNFHKYIRPWKSKRAISINSTAENRFYAVVPLLNFVFFEKYEINKLTDITVPMVQDFLNDYGLCRLPKDNEYTIRGEDIVDQTCRFVIDFLENMIDDNPNAKIKKKDLYKEKDVFSKKKKSFIKKKIPAFKVVYKPTNKETLRDIPDKAFKILLDEIVDNYRNILGLVILEAFAGLRPSEACNVRRSDSALGPGILFDYVDGEVVDIKIDLKQKLNLRSDLKDVGGIKKPRVQRVYHAFLDIFCECYNLYMKYLKDRKYESDYGAFSVNNQGKAMTYNNYNQIFKKAVKSARAKMKESDDPEVVNYGLLLDEHAIGMHIFRHWFSVQLTLRGEDVAGLMYWRGDKNPQSALTYIMNKSDLEKEYSQVTSKIFDYNQWRIRKLYESE